MERCPKGKAHIKKDFEKDVKGFEDKEILDAYDYYKPRERNLGIDEKIYLEVLIKEMKKRFGTCPRCKGPIIGYPAISRKDNETEICSECGQREALQDWINFKLKEQNENN